MKTLLITRDFPREELRETLLQEGVLHIFNNEETQGFESWLRKALEGLDFSLHYGARGAKHNPTVYYIVRMRTRSLLKMMNQTH